MQAAARIRPVVSRPPLYFLCSAAAMVFVYAGTAAQIGHNWWSNENYSHGLFVPVIIAFILWARRRELPALGERPARAAGGLLVAAALVIMWAGVSAPA